MTTAFLELPEHLRWNPIPGSNRAMRDPVTGGFLEVVKAHPFPAISGTFHLQVSPLREVVKVVVHNSCPMLYMREQMCGAISTAQFAVHVYFVGAEYLPDFICSFKAYGWEFALHGRRSTLATAFADTDLAAAPEPLSGPGQGLSMIGN